MLSEVDFFQRFPDLKNSRYYSLRAANILLLVLDSCFGGSNRRARRMAGQETRQHSVRRRFCSPDAASSALHQFFRLENAWWRPASPPRFTGERAAGEDARGLARKKLVRQKPACVSSSSLATCTNYERHDARRRHLPTSFPEAARRTPAPSTAPRMTPSRAKKSTTTTFWWKWTTDS